MIELKGKYNSCKEYTDNIDNETSSQLTALLDQESVKDAEIRIMPDTHAGKGCVIGTTMTLSDKVIPNLVGVDIGCGMRAIRLEEKRIELPFIDSVIHNKVPYEDKVTVKKYGFFESFPAGIEHGWNVMKSYVDQLKYLFTKKGAKSVGGFIGIGKIFSPVWDWAKFWDMTAFLSVALGVMNLLPIPALDGGHAIITVFEMCTGKKPSDKFLEKIQIVGMWLLLGLMLWANLNDILKLIGLY